MRIGIDARFLRGQRTGIGNYIHGLVRLLPRIGPEHEYNLYSNREIDLKVSDGIFRERIDKTFRWCPGHFWLRFRAASLVGEDELDVYWATCPNLPARMPKGVLKVVTVYDQARFHCPETAPLYNIWVDRLFAERAIRDADLIVTISRSTAEDLVRFVGAPDEKLKVVYPGISETYKPRDREKAAEHISAKYRVPPRYLAAVGTVQPRKNLKLLVEVLRILKTNGQLGCPLLVVGASGWKNSALFREIRVAGLTENEIRFLGYMPDEDLPFFYAGAQLFLFPSLYEGFGMPPVEAMACGTPVIASDAQCMPEVLGDAAVLESPKDAQRFATAIVEVLTNESLRCCLQAKGIRRAQRFRWETSARQLLEILEGRAVQKAVSCQQG